MLYVKIVTEVENFGDIDILKTYQMNVKGILTNNYKIKISTFLFFKKNS